MIITRACLSSCIIRVFAAIVLFVSILSLFHPGLALTYTTNLTAGDQASYALAGTYGFYPSQPSTQLNILSVSGTNVTAGFTQFFPDGILTSNVYWVDIDSGTIRNASSTILFAVAPGLQFNDPIYNGWNIKIKEEQTISCGGAARQIEITEFYPYVNGQTYTVRIGWDQNTGIMCRYISANSDQSRVLSMGMSNTTLWSPTPPAPDPFAILADVSAAIGLPLIVLVVYVYYRKRRARKR